MLDFCIDSRGDGEKNAESLHQENINEIQKNIETKSSTTKLLDLSEELPKLFNASRKVHTKQNDSGLTGSYIITSHRNSNDENSSTSDIKNTLKKSSLSTINEKEHAIPLLGKRFLKLQRKKMREKTKGDKWFNIPTTEVTEEVKNDLQILKMRSVLEKNHFYKKNDIKNISKYFQVGTVVENSADFYCGRIVKSKRRKTIVEELLADAECKNYQRKRYKELIDSQRNKSKKKNKN